MESLEEGKKQQLVENINHYNDLLGTFLKMESSNESSIKIEKKEKVKMARISKVCLIYYTVY